MFPVFSIPAEIHNARSCPAYIQILNPTITGCLMPVTATKSIGRRAAIPPASPRSSSMADRVPAAPQAGGGTLIPASIGSSCSISAGADEACRMLAAVGFELSDGRRISSMLVGIDYPRRRMVLPAQRFGEEALSGRCVAFSRQKEVDRRTCGVIKALLQSCNTSRDPTRNKGTL